MTDQTTFSRAMLGYALWIAIEDALRNWLAKHLVELFGNQWDEQIPLGIWNRLHERYGGHIRPEKLSQARELLEHSDFPDLFDIVKYRKKSKDFLPTDIANEIDYYNAKLYALRNQIAHKPYGFSVRDLDDLVGCADWILGFIGPDGANLDTVKQGIRIQPESFAKEIPEEFIKAAKTSSYYKFINNLPPMDYEYDGGFVGRRTERQDIKKRLLDKRLHPILTISGAGGVGKTALAHCVCDDILRTESDAFDGLVWISAKKERLTLTGIEEVEPMAQSFEEVLDTILTTFGFNEYIVEDVERKREIVDQIIVGDSRVGILLVIDNLETIMHDDVLIEYIKDIPLPHKVLITSRLGLGEIERRIPVREMSPGDATELFRRIAIEKSAKQLAQLPTEAIEIYTERMSGYPLVIKWVVSQAAIGKDIDRLVRTINSTDSDISKFCFEYIYDEMLTENAKLILRFLATSEQDLTQAALMHVAELDIQTFENVMRELELASLVIPNQKFDQIQQRIITKYGVLPLTRAYLTSREVSGRQIRDRLQSVQNIVEEARRAKRQFELSLEYLGAETDEELIATKYIQTALTRNQADDYAGALSALEKAKQTAPNFAGVYRSWAIIER